MDIFWPVVLRSTRKYNLTTKKRIQRVEDTIDGSWWRSIGEIEIYWTYDSHIEGKTDNALRDT